MTPFNSQTILGRNPPHGLGTVLDGMVQGGGFWAPSLTQSKWVMAGGELQPGTAALVRVAMASCWAVSTHG